MRFTRTIPLFLLVSVLLAPGSSYGFFQQWGISGKLGTVGVGGELTTDLIPQVNLRAGLNWLSFDVDVDLEGINYDLGFDLFNPMLVVDWHVFNDAFRLSAGVLFNGSDVDLTATPSGDIEIGGITYAAADVGSLQGGLDFDSVAPYVGIGWGNAIAPPNRWTLAIDLGVAFTGSPQVALSATGPIASDPDFQSDLAAERRDIQEDLSDWKFYPILAISLCYRF